MGAWKSDDLVGFWGKVTYSAGTPTLQVNFNLAGIVDDATGRLSWTLGTDMASAHWPCLVTNELTATTYAVANNRKAYVRNGGQAAGTVAIDTLDSTATTNLLADPAAQSIAGFGTQ